MRTALFTRALYLSLAALLMSCASSPPNSVRMELIEPQIRADDDGMLSAEFTFERVISTLDISDGTRVSDLQQLTFNDSREDQISRPATSPTQDAMVYVSLNNGATTVFRQSLGSQAKSPLISETGVNLSPAFTPDGRFLVFSSDRSGESQSLWRKRSDGAGGITQITNSSSFDWQPSVAADGETIIFQSHRRNNIEPSIWSISMNGGLLTQLSLGYSPRVSPDGRRIVFVRKDSSGKEQLWSMQIDASGLTQLSNGTSNDKDPSWHPNGRYIVFASDEAAPGSKAYDYNIWIMSTDGTRRERLTENASHDDAPTFERRGKNIIFRSSRGGQWNLFSFTPNLKES